jgi:hypothetical protein
MRNVLAGLSLVAVSSAFPVQIRDAVYGRGATQAGAE